MTDISYNPHESSKNYIRVILLDEKGNPLKLPIRNDKYTTTIDSGYEDLNLREDTAKIDLYKACDYIDLWHNKSFKIVKRIFMPCVPVSLYLFLKEE